MSVSTRQLVHRHSDFAYEKDSKVTEERFGIYWTSTTSTSSTGELFIIIYRYVCEREVELTNAHVTITARCHTLNGEVHEQKYGPSPLKRIVTDCFFVEKKIDERTAEELVSSVEITFKISAPFPLIRPVSPRKKTWDFSVPGVTDMVLKVGDEKFHVSKMTLATHSSYFNSLFFGPFCESQKPEIELKEVDPEVLQAFLQILYHSADIDEDNVENLLEMARMYDVQPVTRECKKYIKGENTLGDEEKVRLEREYGLDV